MRGFSFGVSDFSLQEAKISATEQKMRDGLIKFIVLIFDDQI